MSLLVLAALFALSCTAAGIGAAFNGWGGPVVSGGSIYVPSKKGSDRASVRVFDSFSGEEDTAQRFTAGGEPAAIYATPLMASVPSGDMMFTTSVYTVGKEDFGRLWAVRADGSGELEWAFPGTGQEARTVGPMFGGAAYSSSTNTVYVGSADGNLYALDATDGSPTKGRGTGSIFNANSPIWSTPTVDNGVVYFGTMHGTLYGIKEGGGLQFEFQAGGAIAATPIVDAGIVYVGSFDRKFYAIDPSGRAKWTFSADNWFWGAPLLAQDARGGDLVFVGSLDGGLYALEAGSGRLRWSFKASQGIRGKPVLVSKTGASGEFVSLTNQVLVVASRNGEVYGFEPNTGAQAWDQPFDTRGRVLTPLAAQGGTVYVTDTNHTLFAIDGSDGRLVWRADQ